MIDSMFKRVIAYLIDMMLVSIVVSSIINSKVVNFQLEDYNKYYDEYYEMYSLYLEQSNNNIESCEDLEKAIEEKKITEEKYISDVETLKDSFSKHEISEEEYNNKCLTIVDDFNSHKMTDEYIEEKTAYYSYNLDKNSIVGYVVNFIVCVLYFVFFQGFTGGQTLGKKLNRIKVVSVNDEKVSYKQLFIRTLFLYSNLYYLLVLIAVLLIPQSSFIDVETVLYTMNSILSLALAFTIAFYKGKSGIHDKVAHTKIVEVDFKGNVIESKKEKNVEKIEEKENIDKDSKEFKSKKNKNMKRN